MKLHHPILAMPTDPRHAEQMAAQLLEANRARFGAAVMMANSDSDSDSDGDQNDADDEDDDGDDENSEPHGEQSSKSLEDVLSELGLTAEQVAGRLVASKKWEKRAKSRADYDQIKGRLAELEQERETDVDRAVREAKEEGAREEREKSFASTAKALLRTGLRHHDPEMGEDDIAEIVDQANLAAFRDEDGDLDDEKIARFVQRNAGTASKKKWPDTGQRSRGDGKLPRQSGKELRDRYLR